MFGGFHICRQKLIVITICTNLKSKFITSLTDQNKRQYRKYLWKSGVINLFYAMDPFEIEVKLTAAFSETRIKIQIMRFIEVKPSWSLKDMNYFVTYIHY